MKFSVELETKNEVAYENIVTAFGENTKDNPCQSGK